MGTGPAALLNYSTPRCFFEREYRYRSWNGVIGGAGLLASAGFAAFMARGFADPGAPFTIARVALWMIVAACAAGTAGLVFKMLRNASNVVRITEEGIEQRGRLHRWHRVGGLGGSVVRGGGILVEFHLRPKTSGLSLTIPKTLMTTPALKRDEFDALIRVLGEYLGAEHRHVKLNPVPRTGD